MGEHLDIPGDVFIGAEKFCERLMDMVIETFSAEEHKHLTVRTSTDVLHNVHVVGSYGHTRRVEFMIYMSWCTVGQIPFTVRFLRNALLGPIR